jgi:class 3 adenylate cyclase
VLLAPPTESGVTGQYDRGMLRYRQSPTEVRFRAWQVARNNDVVRVGMFTLLFGGWFLVGAGALFDPGFARGLWPSVVISSPGFVVAIVATWQPTMRRRTVLIVTSAVTVWGLTITLGTHRALGAPELGTIAVLLVMMFSVQVFRVPQKALFPTVVAPAVLHLALLLRDPDQIAGGAVAHASIAVTVVAAGLLIGHVNERGERLRFEQSEVIAAQALVIEAERRHADALLRKILPSSVVDRLRTGAARIVDHHDGVTVLFADLVGFTPMTRVLPPEEVVSILEDVFAWIDDLAARHGVEKIKTIGDAYMAAAGVPDPRPDHAQLMADFAIAIRDGLPVLSKRLSRDIEMRMGIATGRVVAGIIGESRFAYDLWSDAVNTAARLEALGQPGEIHLDETTARVLEDGYVLTERGMVDVRGKGQMAIWLLDGRRAPEPRTLAPDW